MPKSFAQWKTLSGSCSSCSTDTPSPSVTVFLSCVGISVLTHILFMFTCRSQSLLYVWKRFYPLDASDYVSYLSSTASASVVSPSVWEPVSSGVELFEWTGQDRSQHRQSDYLNLMITYGFGFIDDFNELLLKLDSPQQVYVNKYSR